LIHSIAQMKLSEDRTWAKFHHLSVELTPFWHWRLFIITNILRLSWDY